MVEEGDVQFIDAEQYTGKADEKLTFRMIVLEHLRRIGKLASVEFRGGYYETREVINPSFTNYIKTYVPDTREQYCNAVDYLADILAPYFDGQIKQEEQKLEDAKNKAFDDALIDPAKPATKDNFDKQYYRDEKLNIKRKLFRGLNLFLERVKYLESKTFEEEN